MCLYVDFDREIYDDKVYTFYKLYIKEPKSKKVPLGLVSPFYGSIVKSKELVAKTGNNKPLPEDGQEAYNKYADETRLSLNRFHSRIEYGIHAFTRKEGARLLRCEFPYSNTRIVEVEVLGKHIIAFSERLYDEVAFTRGTIKGIE